MKRKLNNIIGFLPIVSATMLENTEQIIMLVLGTISFILSIIISIINLYDKYKSGQLEIEEIEKEIKKIERKLKKNDKKLHK